MGSLPQLSIIRGPQNDFTSSRLHRLFEKNIVNHENETALIFSQDLKSSPVKTSYNQLNQSANKIARTIIDISTKNGSKPNSDGDWIVAVCMQPSDQLVTILLSIWKSGAAYLPLDPTFPENRIQHILTESKPFLVIHDNSVNGNVFIDTPYHNVDEICKKSLEYSDINISDNEILGSSDNDLALVLYTSGSTGIPKGVRLPHAIILNRLQWQWETFPYSSTEKVGIFKTALTFVDSVSEIWGPLLNGLSILIIAKEITKDPEQLVRILEDYKIERLVLVPTLLRSLLMYLSMNKHQRLLFNLKSWICSGEPLAISLAKDFYDYFQEGVHVLYNFYGSTEVMGDVTYFVCENKNQLENFDKVPIGYPINNTVIYLLDSDYRPVKIGEVGEIFVSGLNLANGYVSNRDPHRFIENPLGVDSKYCRIYRTGDFGTIHKGTIMYEGRTDSQIKIRGHRVDLSEIEKNLIELDSIDKGIVLCYHAGEIDQALVAFVTLNEKKSMCSGLQIESQLKSKLPAYMIPQVIVMETIPLLVNGKIDRQSLLKSYENSNNNDDQEIFLDFDYHGVPEDLKMMAKDLFEIVGKVIGRSTRATLSLSSNFYELGGNSLNSIVTVTELREKGYFIGITDFITAKNLGEILFKLSETEKIISDENNSNMLCQKMEAFPLQLSDKQIVIDIITKSFYGKADLEQWLKPDILETDYADILEDIWEVLVGKDLSFLVKNESGKVIGVALNFDARDEPEVNITSKLLIVFDFLEYVEGPIRDNCLPKGLNKILHSFMMGTNEDLNAQQNIAVMNFMENEVLKLAHRKKYAGIFTTNTNPLTQQLGTNVYNYKIMLDYQVNEYTDKDGVKPFRAAPDSQRAIVHWKEITTTN